jgi:RNA polymerase sigma-70 factor (ECF subfamily)
MVGVAADRTFRTGERTWSCHPRVIPMPDSDSDPGVASAVRAATADLERELVRLVVSNHGRLIRLAGLICDRSSDAEDAVQTAFEQAWRRRTTLRNPDRISAWLDRIVVREAIRLSGRRHGLLARLQSEPRSLDLTDQSIDQPQARDPEPAIRVALRVAYAQLPPPQRAVIALHLYAGYSIVETADAVGAPVETVRSRLRLARERLRAQLGDTPR